MTKTFSTIEADYMKVEQSLADLSQFIQENKGRMPYFSTSQEAENELTLLKKQLKERKQRKPLEVRKSDFDVQLNQIKQQHTTIQTERDEISKLKQSIRDQENEEKSELEEISESLNVLKEQLKNKKAQKQRNELEFKNIQSIVEQLRGEVETVENQRTMLLKQEDKLTNQKQQLINDLSKIEQQNNECSKDEEAIKQVEEETNSKNNEIRKLQKELAQKKKVISKLNKEINKYFDIAYAYEHELDDIIATFPEQRPSSIKYTSIANQPLNNDVPSSYTENSTTNYSSKSSYSSDPVLSPIKTQLEKLSSLSERAPSHHSEDLLSSESSGISPEEAALIKEAREVIAKSK